LVVDWVEDSSIVSTPKVIQSIEERVIVSSESPIGFKFVFDKGREDLEEKGDQV
jgi:hypothetical protein